MRTPNDILDPFLLEAANSAKLAIASGGAWLMANAMPEGYDIAKAASGLTGWGLALACIWTLTKAVKVLFAKLEEKDKAIQQLNDIAVSKADAQRTEMLNELKRIAK